MARAVVFNGDVSALGSLGPASRHAADPIPAPQRTYSAVTWAMVGSATGLDLAYHNVFFSNDYSLEFETLDSGQVPAQPTVYLCAQDRAGEPRSDVTEERLFVLINAPATGDDVAVWTREERARCEQVTWETLRRSGSSITKTAVVESAPPELHRLFPGTGGALYGPRSTGLRSFLARQGARTRAPGLYLAGGSVHPGPGIPMVALSGRLAAQQIREGLTSTRR